MNDEPGICNYALALVGANQIEDLDGASDEAVICNALYEPSRDGLLAEVDWSFATTRRSLASTGDTPAYEYDYEYQLPTDCFRVVETSNDDFYVVEGDKLLCDASSVTIKYIKRVTDVSKMPHLFKQALAFQMAVDMCEALGGKNRGRMKSQLQDRFMYVMDQAFATDAAQDNKDIPKEGSVINAR
mgnify:CR=1 FL=1